MPRPELLFDLIGTIYEAAFDPRHWVTTMKRLCDVFGADKGQIFGFDWRRNEAWLSTGYGTDQTHIDDFVRLLPYDPRGRVFAEFPGRPFSCQLHLPAGELRASRIYKEFFSRPDVDIEYHLGVGEEIEPGVTLGFALFRGTSGTFFEQRDCDEIGRIIPHLLNAGRIAMKFEALRAASTAMKETLDSLLTPIMAVDAACHVLHVNRAAMALAARGHMALRHNQLWLDRPSDSTALRDAVAAVLRCGSGGDAMAVERLCVAVGLDARLSLHVAAVTGAGERAEANRPFALVTILDPQGRYETMPQVLRRLYGLTHAEAELVAGLVRGERAPGIAARRGVAAATVRDQFKSIYRKTGSSGQADLVRLVSSNPIVRSSVLELETGA